jgi:hypothetical protein
MRNPPSWRVLPASAGLVLCALIAAQDRRLADFVPDPASMTRWQQGVSYPQAGFRVLHIEGEPFARGEQHGRLLAREITDYIAMLSSMRSTKAPLDAWRDWRTMTQAWFLPGFDQEWRDEMRGIADGAAAAGAKVGDRAVDFLDIVTVNCAIELDFLENALEATPEQAPRREDHCSAFAATGAATADGHVVFGHITMWSTAPASRFHIWLDVLPASGHRVALQTFPGGIWSGMDWYQNSAGLLLAETTIGQTRFDRDGKPLAQRARQAMQYCASIDAAVEVLGKHNNGLYSNEWLLADTKTDEIATFELGTHKSRLWRSSKNEWFAGTTGFYWGCNNAKDLAVRLETIADPTATTTDVTWRASPRDRAWLQLYDAHRGRIDAEFGFRAFTLPPLCAARSLDAKFTTAALAKSMDSWAIFGPPIGPVWRPTEAELRRNPHTRALVGNDWTLLGKAREAPLSALADASWRSAAPAPKPAGTAPKWQGTVLAATDADVWLPAAIVACREALGAKDVDLAAFQARARAGAAERRLGKRLPLTALQPEARQGDWYEVGSGKGTLLLLDLRREIGEARFDELMTTFLARHAGKAVTTGDFLIAAEQAYGTRLDGVFAQLNQAEWPAAQGPCWSIDAFEREPEHALIVYGTQREARANKEAAEVLQRQLAARWYNVQIPLRSDAEITADEMKSHHLVLVGRPVTNAITAKCASALPVRFGDASFELAGTCGREDAAVVVAGDNPQNPRWSVVVFAGLSADATWRLVQLPKETLAVTCEALVLSLATPVTLRAWARPR